MATYNRFVITPPIISFSAFMNDEKSIPSQRIQYKELVITYDAEAVKTIGKIDRALYEYDYNKHIRPDILILGPDTFLHVISVVNLDRPYGVPIEIPREFMDCKIIVVPLKGTIKVTIDDPMKVVSFYEYGI